MAVLSVLDREHTVAPPGYSRWLIRPVAARFHERSEPTMEEAK
ncbi:MULTISPECIES: hypothetical protein [unclassified Kribbella]